MTTQTTSIETGRLGTRTRIHPLILGLAPLILLIGVLALIISTDGGLGERELPPIETLAVQRVTLPEAGQIEIEIINDGPDDFAIAQVLVDDAYWQFEMEPAGTLERL